MIKVLPAHIATEMLRKKRKDRLKAMLDTEISYDNDKKDTRLNKSNPKAADSLNRKVSTVNFLASNKSETNLESAATLSKSAKQDSSNKLFNDKPNRPKSSGFHDLNIKSHSNVSILYADIVNFTPLADKFEPPELVNILNKLFSEFDQKADVNSIFFNFKSLQ